MKDLRTDAELLALIPPHSVEEHAKLEENLVRDGCLDSIKVWRREDGNPVKLDGHNRHEICERLGIAYEVEEIKTVTSLLEAKLWVANNQLGRRNLSDYAKFELVKKIDEFEAERIAGLERKAEAAKKRAAGAARGERGTFVRQADQDTADLRYPGGESQVSEVADSDLLETPPGEDSSGEGQKVARRRGSATATVSSVREESKRERSRKKASGRTSAVLANKAGMSQRQYEKAKYVDERADADTKKLLRSKKLSMDAAYKQLRSDEKKLEREEKRTRLAKTERTLPSSKFSVILADPPWQYEYSASASRKIENQYPTMSVDEICSLPIREIVNENAVLYLWVTSPKLKEGLAVLEAWGFTYKSCMVWVKDRIGMGYWARQQHELILIGTMGNFSPPNADVRPASVIEAPRGKKHSKKPNRLHEIIEGAFPGFDKVELFCREPRDGWAAWGNES